MKILYDHSLPFLLAHGGFQIQIEQTMQAVSQFGLEVEPVRWWDDTQTGDLIHYFGRPSGAYIDFAQQKGISVVVAELHSGLASRSARARFAQRLLMKLCQKVVPKSLLSKLAWEAYRKADAFIVNTSWEGEIIHTMFDAARNKTNIVPNGVEQVFFDSPVVERGKWLVTTATITERKRVLELTEAAIVAEVPLRIIGKPYAENDPYFIKFRQLAQRTPELIRYQGSVNDRAEMASVYRSARGFVLLSSSETLSLSADEAAACQCPLLLSDLPWAHSAFGKSASYLSLQSGGAKIAATLKAFYNTAPEKPIPRTPPTWPQVGRQFADLYATLLATTS